MIIGIQGIHPEGGLTNEFLPEAVVDRVLVAFAPQLIIVADSSKVGKIKASAVGRIEDIGAWSPILRSIRISWRICSGAASS